MLHYLELQEASPPRSAPYKTDLVASEKSQEDPEISRNVNPCSNVSPSTLKFEL